MRPIMLLMLATIQTGLVSCANDSAPARSGASEPDLGFLPARPEKGRVFALYNYHGKSLWKNNWTAGFDLTGVAWNDPRTATAISRNHVVMAGHFIRPTTIPLIFHDRDGHKHERSITRVLPLTGVADIAVGQLNQPLPAGVKHYRLASPGDAQPMRLVLVTDQTMTLSLHRLGRLEGNRVVLGYDPRIEKTYWRNLVTGDSGNPAFILRNGEPHLLTTFSTGGPGTGPFYGDPAVSQALAEVMGRLR